MAKAVAKRTVVLSATILGMARSMLTTVGALILWIVDVKMPCKVAVKTNSLSRHCGFWAQVGILRCNMSGMGSGMALLKGGARVSGDVQ